MKHLVLLFCNGACLINTHIKNTYTHPYIHTYILITRIYKTFTSGEGKAGQQSSSNIFLVFVNNENLSAIKNWEIPEHWSSTDHNLITFNQNITKNKAKIYNLLEHGT